MFSESWGRQSQVNIVVPSLFSSGKLLADITLNKSGKASAAAYFPVQYDDVITL